MGLCQATLMNVLFDGDYDWHYVNLNTEFLQCEKSLDMFQIEDQNALLKQIHDKYVGRIKRNCSCDPGDMLHRSSSLKIATYGGFGENRSQIWKHFEPCTCETPYDCRCTMIHLGVDFNNLNPGTRVKSVCDGTVVHIMRGHHDSKNNVNHNGWGGRVIVYDHVKRVYVLYGHLDPKHLPCVGQMLAKHETVGYLGSSAVNGGWFAHLHFQVMTSEFVDLFPDLDKLDGYELSSLEIPNGVLDPFLVY